MEKKYRCFFVDSKLSKAKIRPSVYYTLSSRMGPQSGHSGNIKLLTLLIRKNRKESEIGHCQRAKAFHWINTDKYKDLIQEKLILWHLNSMTCFLPQILATQDSFFNKQSCVKGKGPISTSRHWVRWIVERCQVCGRGGWEGFGSTPQMPSTPPTL